MAELTDSLEQLEGALMDAHHAASAVFADALNTDASTQDAVRSALVARAEQLDMTALLETTAHLSRAAFALSAVDTASQTTPDTTEATPTPDALQIRPLLEESLLDTLFDNAAQGATDDVAQVPHDAPADEAEEFDAIPEPPKSLREQRNYFEHSLAPGNLRQFVIRIMPPAYVDTIREMKYDVLALQLIADMMLERYMAILPTTQSAFRLGNRRQATIRRWCGMHEMDMEPADIAVKQTRNTQQVMADIHHVIEEITARFSAGVLEEIFEAGVNHRYIPLTKDTD